MCLKPYIVHHIKESINKYLKGHLIMSFLSRFSGFIMEIDFGGKGLNISDYRLLHKLVHSEKDSLLVEVLGILILVCPATNPIVLEL